MNLAQTISPDGRVFALAATSLSARLIQLRRAVESAPPPAERAHAPRGPRPRPRDVSDAIKRVLAKAPGAKFEEIVRATGRLRGVVTTELGRLRQREEVRVEGRRGGYRYYLAEDAEE